MGRWTGYYPCFFSVAVGVSDDVCCCSNAGAAGAAGEGRASHGGLREASFNGTLKGQQHLAAGIPKAPHITALDYIRGLTLREGLLLRERGVSPGLERAGGVSLALSRKEVGRDLKRGGKRFPLPFSPRITSQGPMMHAGWVTGHVGSRGVAGLTVAVYD
ncbi:unnamed protein product [Ectocarpus fasciculatus]